MSRFVTLNLAQGDWRQGFSLVIVQLWETGGSIPMRSTGSLPPAPELFELHRKWRLFYEALCSRLGWRQKHVSPSIEIEPDGVNHVSPEKFRVLCQELKEALNQWLKADQFRSIDQMLRTYLSPGEDIRIMIETEDALLRRFPWRLWEFFEDYPRAELAIAAQTYSRPTTVLEAPGERLRILAIFGDSTGITVDRDRTLLTQFAAAEVVCLVEPQRQELDQCLWDKQGWDILFFAGHSASELDGTTGRIEVNQTQDLTIEQLKNALKASINQGLQLAIFNSCDGLGLARSLADLQIPQLIVMREPVPDLIAQAFLQSLLSAFASGKALYPAVREASEKLQGLENQFPCASWLPVICQNPAAISTNWPNLQTYPFVSSALPTPPQTVEPVAAPSSKSRLLQFPRGRKHWLAAGLISLAIAVLVIGIRGIGLLESSELAAYDRFLQLRPHETQDERLLIVKIEEADIQYQQDQGMAVQGSLSDQALTLLLQKLKKFEPQSVGLDLYRTDSFPSAQTSLGDSPSTDMPLFVICKAPAPEAGDLDGVAPPRNFPDAYVGFSDFVVDRDSILRRHLLAFKNPAPESHCTTGNSFNLLIALHYLETAAGIRYQLTPDRALQLGETVFTRLTANAGGYHQLDASGYQMLLNYRTHRSPSKIAPTLSLRKILADGIPASSIEKLKGRIVLVGVTGVSSGDAWLTPYSWVMSHADKNMPGVMLQAQMISQILSAALEPHRPLIWWWPEWGEMLWIWGWATVGGMLAGLIRRPLILGVSVAASLAILQGICYSFFMQAGWIPIIPAAIAMVLASVGVAWGLNPIHVSKKLESD